MNHSRFSEIIETCLNLAILSIIRKHICFLFEWFNSLTLRAFLVITEFLNDSILQFRFNYNQSSFVSRNVRSNKNNNNNNNNKQAINQPPTQQRQQEKFASAALAAATTATAQENHKMVLFGCVVAVFVFLNKWMLQRFTICGFNTWTTEEINQNNHQHFFNVWIIPWYIELLKCWRI